MLSTDVVMDKVLYPLPQSRHPGNFKSRGTGAYQRNI